MRKDENKNLFALVGKNISYSFSRKYFTDKFLKLDLKGYEYVNFDIQHIDEFESKLASHKKVLRGMNVTIPYKLEIFKFLDLIDEEAKKIGAVNTIKITKEGILKGFNTDVYGFKVSLEPLLQSYHKSALILGTGGASRAVAYALQSLGISYTYVSRKENLEKGILAYSAISQEVIESNLLIINCTPLGTYPDTNQCPNIPYHYITKQHLLYDLIYNPLETTFLKRGNERGALVKNGLEMLEQQAERAWQIWRY
ncbi:shikimate dehydrogenase [Tenacibaculum sp. SG-28]|uniref:shikimate dehydrogenase family protein n=1 Tax=Tenacibaculum sp. SG-28 TaxID=754426 RepID=UPI000CF4156F|nr:shikimate dehydrogenase [Tenacibaculum sp. SG-28]PQJ22903.1 shikimate dehydrogenase [Tenacibaculum sp. SG-28]